MTEVETATTIEKIYAEILNMKEELKEIKSAIILEDQPDQEEIKAFQKGKEEITAGKIKAWDTVKKDLGI